MTTRYAYLHPYTREYQYVDTREELLNVLAKNAAQVYIEHYSNGHPFTFVEVQEDGSEKWYAPTGEQVLSASELEAHIKHIQAFENAGVLSTTRLGG